MTTIASPAHLDLLGRINGERTKAGLVPIVLDPALMQAAQFYAEDMARRDYFRYDHTTPEGETARQRALRFGYPDTASTGENIQYGPATAAEAHEVWMTSPPHRNNILTASYRACGIGGPADPAWDKQGDVFNAWCVDFGSVVTGQVPVREGPLPELPPDPPNPDREARRAQRTARDVRRDERDAKQDAWPPKPLYINAGDERGPKRARPIAVGEGNTAAPPRPRDGEHDGHR